MRRGPARAGPGRNSGPARSFSAIDLLRCVMLSQALSEGFDRFLFIDADIGFSVADALRLMDRPEPVVAGIYMKKNSRDYSGAFAAGVNRVVFGPAAPGLYPMLYASTGFLRVRAEVLHRMIDELKLPLCHWGPVKGFYPFFLPLCVPDGRGGTRYLTEDYSFSHRLHQIGVTPMADTTIKLYHFGKYGFSYEDLAQRQTVLNCTMDIEYAEGRTDPKAPRGVAAVAGDAVGQDDLVHGSRRLDRCRGGAGLSQPTPSGQSVSRPEERQTSVAAPATPWDRPEDPGPCLLLRAGDAGVQPVASG